MATLFGNAVKISWLGADHTYVTSSDGGKWGCWGKDSGGGSICSGVDSSAHADCLSKPWGTAAIIYGVTGVCHQTANRILWGARCIVSAARGYWASSLVYGTYGKDYPVWLGKILICSGVKTSAKELKKSDAGKKSADMVYVEKIMRMYAAEQKKARVPRMKLETTPAVIQNELQLMMDFRMGKAFSAPKKKVIATHQAKLFKLKGDLDNSYFKKEMKGKAYAKTANQIINDTFKGIATNIGEDDYERMFGLKPDVKVNLIDPQIMVESEK